MPYVLDFVEPGPLLSDEVLKPPTISKASGDEVMQLMSVSAAARHLGYKSRSQLYKLMNDGWLDAHVHVQMPSGQRLLDVDGLQKTLQGLCQWRVDSVFLRR